MIKSMTGYGKCSKDISSGMLAVEIRSVNSRYADVAIKVPEFLEMKKDDFASVLSRKLKRGRIQALITYNNNKTNSSMFKINLDYAKNCFDELKKLESSLGLKDSITLEHLLEIPDLFTNEEPDIDLDEISGTIKELLSTAGDELTLMREDEGKYLTDEITKHLKNIQVDLNAIIIKIADRKQSYFQKYRDLINEMIGDRKLDEDRILQEVAIMTKKVDISEECERIASHTAQFEKYLKSDQEVGKKMNFLVQELNREMTTIGAKSESAEISHMVVNMKNELEKVREQVQNIL